MKWFATKDEEGIFGMKYYCSICNKKIKWWQNWFIGTDGNNYHEDRCYAQYLRVLAEEARNVKIKPEYDYGKIISDLINYIKTNDNVTFEQLNTYHNSLFDNNLTLQEGCNQKIKHIHDFPDDDTNPALMAYILSVRLLWASGIVSLK